MKTKLGVAYIGSKSRCLSWVYSLFPKNFKCFVDVFAGGGWVSLNFDEKGIIKVLNDKDELITNFFMVLRDNKNELKRRLYYLPYSRSLSNKYKKLVKENKLPDDEIEKAVIWLYAVKTSFSGDLYSGFGVSIDKRRSISLSFKEFIDKSLDKMADCLKNIIIENLDFRDVIKKYDSENTFFYLDPPYKSVHKFRIEFTEKDRKDLIEILKNIKGKFLLNCFEEDFDFREFDKNWIIEKKYFLNFGFLVKNKKKRPKKAYLAVMNYQLLNEIL